MVPLYRVIRVRGKLCVGLLVLQCGGLFISLRPSPNVTKEFGQWTLIVLDNFCFTSILVAFVLSKYLCYIFGLPVCLSLIILRLRIVLG